MKPCTVYKKIVSLKLKFMKNLLIYLLKLEIFFPLLWLKFYRGTAINFLRKKVIFSATFEPKIVELSAIWQH